MSLSRSRYFFFKQYHSVLNRSLVPALQEYKSDVRAIIQNEFKYSRALYATISRALLFSCLLSYTMNNARVWSLIRTYFLNSNYKILFFTRDKASRLRAYLPRARNIIDSFRNRIMLSVSVAQHETYEQAFASVDRCHNLSLIFNELTFGGFFLHGVFYTYDNYKKLKQRITKFRITDLHTLWSIVAAHAYFVAIVLVVRKVYTFVTTRIFPNKRLSVLKEVVY